MNRRLYALHRWLSAIAFVQLALWTLSGAVFAFLPIETVRGTFVADAHLRPVNGASAMAPRDLMARAGSASEASDLCLRASPAGEFWILRGKQRATRFDASTGALAPVTREEANATARRDQPGAPAVRSAELLESAPNEYRGKPLPAWRVELEDAGSTVVYIDASTGEVTARRNELWRTYDAFWALHIMDYRERESFNHWLLRGAALVAFATVLSGTLLWALRAWRWFGARRHRTSSG